MLSCKEWVDWWGTRPMFCFADAVVSFGNPFVLDLRPADYKYLIRRAREERELPPGRAGAWQREYGCFSLLKTLLEILMKVAENHLIFGPEVIQYANANTFVDLSATEVHSLLGEVQRHVEFYFANY